MTSLWIDQTILNTRITNLLKVILFIKYQYVILFWRDIGVKIKLSTSKNVLIMPILPELLSPHYPDSSCYRSWQGTSRLACLLSIYVLN